MIYYLLRASKVFASNRTFATMDELVSDYESGALHPADVKPALAKAINEILQVKFSSLSLHFFQLIW
jgi:hypothetical protein